MGTGIGWTDETWSAIVGCTRASDGCRNCYSERFMARFSGIKGHKFQGISKFTKDGPRWSGEVRFAEEALREPLHWRKPRKVFVCSISDLFHEKVEQKWIDKIFAIMAMTPRHTYQCLTKRAERMRDYLRHSDVAQRVTQEMVKIKTGKWPASMPMSDQVAWPLENVHLGISAENQKEFDQRWPFLAETPARIRWLSLEPLLGKLSIQKPLDHDINRWGIPAEAGGTIPLMACEEVIWSPNKIEKRTFRTGPHWVVVGGESGPGARPTHPDWARGLRDQCVEAGVAFNLKQLGNWVEGRSIDGIFWYKDADGKERVLSGDTWAKIHYWEYEKGMSFQVGKKAAGRKLDGIIWDQYPTEAVNA